MEIVIFISIILIIFISVILIIYILIMNVFEISKCFSPEFPLRKSFVPKFYEKKLEQEKKYPKNKIPFNEEPNLFRFVENGKWGIINSNNEILLAPSYNYIDEFHEGIANIIIIECNRYYTSNRNSNKTDIYFEEKYGLVDNRCSIISEPKFSFIDPFINGESIATTHKQCLIDRNGNIIKFTGGNETWHTYDKEIAADHIKRLSNGFYYLFKSWAKKDGYSQVNEIVNHEKVIIWTGYLFASNDEYRISDYMSGILKISCSWNNKTIFIDEKGQVIFTSYYSFISDCKDNRIRFRSNKLKYIIYNIDRKCFARVYSDVDIIANDDVIVTVQDNKRRLFNYRGEELKEINQIIDSELFDFNFSSESNNIYFSENMCLVKLKENGLIGYINKKGEVVIEPQYDNGTAFKNGYAKVLIKQNDENYWCFISKRGDVGLKIKNKSFTHYLESDPRFIVYNENNNEDLYHIINVNGVVIYTGKIHNTRVLTQDLIAIIIYKSSKPDDVIILNYKGVKYTGVANDIRVHSNGFVELWTYNESAILDSYGNFIYQAKYNSSKIKDVVNPIPFEIYQNIEYKVINQDGKKGLMNATSNTIIINPKYDWIYHPIDRYFIASENNKLGVYDLNGKVLLAPFCHSYKFTKDNHLFFLINQYGYLNELGDVAVQPIYEDASDFKDGTAIVNIEGINFSIDIYGNQKYEHI